MFIPDEMTHPNISSLMMKKRNEKSLEKKRNEKSLTHFYLKLWLNVYLMRKKKLKYRPYLVERLEKKIESETKKMQQATWNPIQFWFECILHSVAHYKKKMTFTNIAEISMKFVAFEFR